MNEAVAWLEQDLDELTKTVDNNFQDIGPGLVATIAKGRATSNNYSQPIFELKHDIECRCRIGNITCGFLNPGYVEAYNDAELRLCDVDPGAPCPGGSHP
ncbi:hypothetical protein [Streptomyces microflavus]|uniref:hypothetical protein n=1 Tax=Streptomyces microflavus TaxID=1919 RepID=UPI00369BA84C